MMQVHENTEASAVKVHGEQMREREREKKQRSRSLLLLLKARFHANFFMPSSRCTVCVCFGALVPMQWVSRWWAATLSHLTWQALSVGRTKRVKENEIRVTKRRRKGSGVANPFQALPSVLFRYIKEQKERDRLAAVFAVAVQLPRMTGEESAVVTDSNRARPRAPVSFPSAATGNPIWLTWVESRVKKHELDTSTERQANEI